MELAAVELLAAGDVLRRLALHALVQIAAVVNPPDLAQLFIGMGVEPRPLATDGVGEQHLGGQTRSGDPGVVKSCWP